MRHFELIEPRSFADACAALATEAGSRPVAGGTALLTIIRQGLLRPQKLVNLQKIRDGSAITFAAQAGMRIGALTTIHAIETSSLVRQHYPILAEACHAVANIRIRNMATLGGNLAHGDYQSDPPTVLAVLNAKVELTTKHGIREMGLSEFQRGSYDTALETGELLTAILIPPLRPGFTGVYLKFTTGSAGERPCAGLAALARMEDGICRELRLGVGAVSQRPLRIAAAEDQACDKALDHELIESMAAEAARAVDPIEDVRGSADYKRRLVQVLARRAITAALSDACEATP